MINVQEFRIGNYVEVNGNLTMVTAIGLMTIIVASKSPDPELSDVKPIPLTPELLKKCGFKRMELNGESSYQGNEKLNFGNPVLWLNTYSKLKTNGGHLYLFTDDGFRIPCRYIHQLQNIYFALTQKELPLAILQ